MRNFFVLYQPQLASTLTIKGRRLRIFRPGSVQVLEISARELGVCNNLNLSIADLGDLDDITEVSNTAVDLDLVLEELLEGGDVENLVAGGLRSVDDELFLQLAHCNASLPPLSPRNGERIRQRRERADIPSS